MSAKKSKHIKTSEVHLQKEALRHLVKVTDTPRAWAFYDRLWELALESLKSRRREPEAS